MKVRCKRDMSLPLTGATAQMRSDRGKEDLFNSAGRVLERKRRRKPLF